MILSSQPDVPVDQDESIIFFFPFHPEMLRGKVQITGSRVYCMSVYFVVHLFKVILIDVLFVLDYSIFFFSIEF